MCGRYHGTATIGVSIDTDIIDKGKDVLDGVKDVFKGIGLLGMLYLYSLLF